MKRSDRTPGQGLVAAAAMLGALAFAAPQAQAAATIVINNINAAGVGFNDTDASAHRSVATPAPRSASSA